MEEKPFSYVFLCTNILSSACQSFMGSSSNGGPLLPSHYTGLSSNGKITEEEEREKTKKNKIKKKNKIFFFFPSSVLVLPSPHISFLIFHTVISFLLPCLPSPLGGKDGINQKHEKHKEGKTGGASGQSEAFSSIPLIVKLFFCNANFSSFAGSPNIPAHFYSLFSEYCHGL